MANDATTVEQLPAELRHCGELRAVGQEEMAALRAKRTEAIEQQVATRRIMRAIVSSPVDAQGVLDEIAEAAAHLGGVDRALIHRVEGEAIWGVAPPVPSRAPGSQLLQEFPVVAQSAISGTARQFMDRPET
jgi:hypothetical protein